MRKRPGDLSPGRSLASRLAALGRERPGLDEDDEVAGAHRPGAHTKRIGPRRRAVNISPPLRRRDRSRRRWPERRARALRHRRSVLADAAPSASPLPLGEGRAGPERSEGTLREEDSSAWKGTLGEEDSSAWKGTLREEDETALAMEQRGVLAWSASDTPAL